MGEKVETERKAREGQAQTVEDSGHA